MWRTTEASVIRMVMVLSIILHYKLPRPIVIKTPWNGRKRDGKMAKRLKRFWWIELCGRFMSDRGVDIRTGHTHTHTHWRRPCGWCGMVAAWLLNSDHHSNVSCLALAWAACGYVWIAYVLGVKWRSPSMMFNIIRSVEMRPEFKTIVDVYEYVYVLMCGVTRTVSIKKKKKK